MIELLLLNEGGTKSENLMAKGVEEVQIERGGTCGIQENTARLLLLERGLESLLPKQGNGKGVGKKEYSYPCMKKKTIGGF